MTQKPLRLVYMGTPDFAVPALEALHKDASVHMVGVYTQPPRPRDRGYKVTPSPVHQKAESLGLPVFFPPSLKGIDAQEVLRNLKPDLIIVAAYGLILPRAVLDIPILGCINIHGSLLPRWRGAAPIQRAILAGDTKTGVTIMKMDVGLDTGDMILAKSTPIDNKTSTDLYIELAHMGADLIIKTVHELLEGSIKFSKQTEEGVTYAQKINKEEGLLDWTIPASVLLQQIRAFTPWPGSWFELKGQIIKVLEAEVVQFEDTVVPGTIVDQDLTIACGKDALRIQRLQPAGKPAMDAEAFQNGTHLKVGQCLGESGLNATL
ncbi:MAG: methionyl-tRNA formyltransferase [Alphaproteobacteria bacterium]|nr:methionyl-tRNA formyltransferase [Alphaproteobacteria bacterium]